MKYKLVLLLFCLTILALSLGGCAALREKPKAKEPPEVLLERVLLERALEYERKGDSQKALQFYEAALTVIVAKKTGLEESLLKDAEKHYQMGLDYHEQGKYSIVSSLIVPVSVRYRSSRANNAYAAESKKSQPKLIAIENING